MNFQKLLSPRKSLLCLGLVAFVLGAKLFFSHISFEDFEYFSDVGNFRALCWMSPNPVKSDLPGLNANGKCLYLFVRVN